MSGLKKNDLQLTLDGSQDYLAEENAASDRTRLSVTFGAMREGVRMPFGADRQLLAWMFDSELRKGGVN